MAVIVVVAVVAVTANGYPSLAFGNGVTFPVMGHLADCCIYWWGGKSSVVDQCCYDSFLGRKWCISTHA
eukprot:7687401-Ditylum_brightwellii.AAC.1